MFFVNHPLFCLCAKSKTGMTALCCLPLGYLSMIVLTLEKFSSDHSNVLEFMLDTVLIIPG